MSVACIDPANLLLALPNKMIKPEPTRTKNPAPRFYRQYIDENHSLSAAPSPVSSLLPTHLRAPSLPSSRNEAKDATGRAQPRRSLDIASKALGIKSLTLNSTDAVTQTAAPLLDARPTLTLHLPNGRVLPPLSPTASNFSPRARSSSLGQTGSQNVGQAAGTGHYRSASHTFSSPTTPIPILHPPRAPYCNASSGPLPFRSPLPSPVITIREPSPPPSESRSAVQSQTQSRKNSTDLGETETARLEQVPGDAAASNGRAEKSISAPDALAGGDPSPRQSGSRPSLEDHTGSHNHTPDIAAGRKIQQTEANPPSPYQETEEPMLDNINDKTPLSPPAQQSSFDSSNRQRSRGRSMELTRTKHVRRPRHRASTQPLQMADPMSISISAKESSSEGNGGSSRSSLETLSRNRSLTLPGSLPQQPNDNASTHSIQTRARGSFLDTKSVAVIRLTSLNSHPPSPVIEREHTRSQSLDTNHHSGPPAIPLRHRYASLPVPRIGSPSIPSKTDASLAPAMDSEAVFPPQPQQQPQFEPIITSRASSLPVTTTPPASSPLAPNPHSAIQSSPPHLEAHQHTTRLSLSKFTTQSLTTLRAVASASKIHSASTSLSSPRPKFNSSSSSCSTASASTTSIPTPQSPPFRPPSPTNTFNLPLATLTQHMTTQLGQARHLLATLSHHLSPAEDIWIHDTVSDAEGTVREILILTEPLRVDREVNDGRLGLKTQLKWAVRGSWKAKDMRARLNLCHSSLVAILMRLQDLEAEYAETVAEHAAAKTETGTSDGRNPMTSANVYVEGPTTSEPESLHKNSAVQMEDLSLESVVDEHTGVETRSADPQSPISIISREDSIEPAPEKLNNELVDMLSWRWSQGREKTTQ
ncbi:uncharacterized protein BDW70DRAFT_104006 [Aspergillus foveolatus]|uniref:uncharacterized protein n=1 Tax=Aspergillus foveolatus TaxID=210207 RepID=UPI003CCE441B